MIRQGERRCLRLLALILTTACRLSRSSTRACPTVAFTQCFVCLAVSYPNNTNSSQSEDSPGCNRDELAFCRRGIRPLLQSQGMAPTEHKVGLQPPHKHDWYNDIFHVGETLVCQTEHGLHHESGRPTNRTFLAQDTNRPRDPCSATHSNNGRMKT